MLDCMSSFNARSDSCELCFTRVATCPCAIARIALPLAAPRCERCRRTCLEFEGEISP